MIAVSDVPVVLSVGLSLKGVARRMNANESKSPLNGREQ